jgi:hypothetical protein
MPFHIQHECEGGDCGGTCNLCCLDVCKICGEYEGGLTVDCPGYEVRYDTYSQDVYGKVINYTDERGWFRNHLNIGGANFEKDNNGKVLLKKEFPSLITSNYRGEIRSLHLDFYPKELTFSDAVIMICNPHDSLSFESINQMIKSDSAKNQLEDKTCFVCGIAPRDQLITFIESTPFAAKSKELRAARGLCVLVFDSGVIEVHENVDKLIT